MPVSVRRSSSYSSLSTVGSDLHSLAGGMSLKSMGGFGFPVVHDGYGTHKSNFSSSVVPTYEVSLGANEKMTMQNLNHRLATYLEKVRSLEASNKKLELKIKEFYETRSPVYSKDLSRHYGIIEDLRKQILTRVKESAQLDLQVDNTRLAVADFKMKYETEMNMRLAVEADIARLRATSGEIQMDSRGLELQISGLEEELAFLRKNHEEEMHLLRAQQSGSVNVQVDSAPSVDMEKNLQEMREQYEALIQKNRRDAELWFHSKAETLQVQVKSSCTEIQTSQTVITDLKRTFQNLEIERDGLFMQKQMLEKSLADVGLRYSAQLSQLQLRIDHLQQELQKLNTSMQQQSTEYQLLLDIKMRLELEIAEYRRLLEGEGARSAINTTTSTVTETVTKTVEIQEEVEEHNPHHQRRVKVIVEELVDGKVVSTSVDEKIQEMDK